MCFRVIILGGKHSFKWLETSSSARSHMFSSPVLRNRHCPNAWAVAPALLFQSNGTCGRWYLLLIPLITLVSCMWCLSVPKRRLNQGILISSSLGVCILFGGRERSDGPKPQLFRRRALILIRARSLQKASRLREISVGTSVIQICRKPWRRAWEIL